MNTRNDGFFSANWVLHAREGRVQLGKLTPEHRCGPPGRPLQCGRRNISWNNLFANWRMYRMMNWYSKLRRTVDNDIQAVMNRVSLYLDEWDGILRRAHSIYTKYQPEFVVDHDSSTQAHYTYRHILAVIPPRDCWGKLFSALRSAMAVICSCLSQPTWLFVSIKQTDQGISANHPTKQAQDFEILRTASQFTACADETECWLPFRCHSIWVCPVTSRASYW